MAYPVFPRAPEEQLSFSGMVKFHILPLIFGFVKPSFSHLSRGLFACLFLLQDQDSLVMAVKRFSLTTFWEVCRSSRWKPWPEETLRLDFKIAKMLLCGAFLKVECDV